MRPQRSVAGCAPRAPLVRKRCDVPRQHVPCDGSGGAPPRRARPIRRSPGSSRVRNAGSPWRPHRSRIPLWRMRSGPVPGQWYLPGRRARDRCRGKRTSPASRRSLCPSCGSRSGPLGPPLRIGHAAGRVRILVRSASRGFGWFPARTVDPEEPHCWLGTCESVNKQKLPAVTVGVKEKLREDVGHFGNTGHRSSGRIRRSP